MNILAVAYVLMTIVGGHVEISSGMDKQICQKAKSLFLNGSEKEINDCEKDRKGWLEAKDRNTIKFYEEHPPRKPKDEELEYIKNGMDRWVTPSKNPLLPSGNPMSHLLPDGNVQDEKYEWILMERSDPDYCVSEYKKNGKIAVCTESHDD